MLKKPRRYNMQLKCSSVTRIVLKGLLSTQQVLLQVGDQQLLPPVGGDVLLHPDQLGHNVKGYTVW